MFDANDHRHMSRVIQLANKPIFSPHPNPRVGCLIVKDNTVIGEGFHEFAGGPHAEVNALEQAGVQAELATVYISLEPCCFHGRTPPCVNALINAKVSKVFVAMLDPNPKVSGQGVSQLQEAGIEVKTGLLEEQAKELNKGFIQRMRKGRPWVRCKIAMSFDGRTALNNGESQWISGKAARRDVQAYRAKSDAILTGIGTVKTDNPQMTIRDLPSIQEAVRQPLRVIVDSRLKSDFNAIIFNQPGDTLIATLNTEHDSGVENVKIKSFASKNDKVDLLQLLKYMADQEINEVQVEAGATLNGALLSEGLVDELVVYMANILMGDSARGIFNLPELTAMDEKLKLHCLDVRQIGEDFRFIMRPEIVKF